MLDLTFGRGAKTFLDALVSLLLWHGWRLSSRSAGRGGAHAPGAGLVANRNPSL
jgi:hypothetical protein